MPHEIVKPTAETVAAYWSAFVTATGTTGSPIDVWAFGDSPELADKLADLVLNGPRRATAGLLADYESDETPLPRVGEHSVVHWGDGRPAMILATTDVRVGPLSSVDAQFAWDEGEGDRTLEWWLAAHERFFRRRCDGLGMVFEPDISVVFERFDVAWPR